MSVKIVQTDLPAGVVPFEDISDPTVKKKVMLLNKNIMSLSEQLKQVQKAIIELQRR